MGVSHYQVSLILPLLLVPKRSHPLTIIRPSNLFVWVKPFPPNPMVPQIAKFFNPSFEWMNFFLVTLCMLCLISARMIYITSTTTIADGVKDDREVRMFVVFDGEGNIVDPGYMMCKRDRWRDKEGKMCRRISVGPTRLSKERVEEAKEFRRKELEEARSEAAKSTTETSGAEKPEEEKSEGGV